MVGKPSTGQLLRGGPPGFIFSQWEKTILQKRHFGFDNFQRLAEKGP